MGAESLLPPISAIRTPETCVIFIFGHSHRHNHYCNCAINQGGSGHDGGLFPHIIGGIPPWCSNVIPVQPEMRLICPPHFVFVGDYPILGTVFDIDLTVFGADQTHITAKSTILLLIACYLLVRNIASYQAIHHYQQNMIINQHQKTQFASIKIHYSY